MLDFGIDLNVWPWIWMATAIIFAIVELAFVGGSFIVLPWAISAFAAGILGFYDAPIELQWAVFVLGGGVMFAILYKWARRFTAENKIPAGVGADRLVGLDGVVTITIDPSDTDRKGRVSIHGETWGALSKLGVRLAAGTPVKVVEMQGTRVMVVAQQREMGDVGEVAPPTRPPT